VPGYLSAVSAIEADRLGTPGAARRVALASLPFILGFTVVFVILGIAAAAIGGILPSDRQLELAGLILVVIGLTFIGLLPWPERLLAPGLVTGARRRNSNLLLGAAFAICAAPCIGAVLASILAIATTSSVVKGAVLLAVYSAGLGLAFLLAAVGFTQAMGAFRWLRDHYRAIQFAGGLVMVALGLLLFFDRFYILRIYVNRVFEWLGLEPVF
jgi:cytochrome c-type biogenesis protein